MPLLSSYNMNLLFDIPSIEVKLQTSQELAVQGLPARVPRTFPGRMILISSHA